MIKIKIEDLNGSTISHNLFLANQEMCYGERLYYITVDVKEDEIDKESISVYDVYANVIESPIAVAIYIQGSLEFIVDVIDFESIVIDESVLTITDCCSVTTVNIDTREINCV